MSPFRIRVATLADLPALEQGVRASFGRPHTEDLKDQSSGELTLMTAWVDSLIVGSGFARWLGPRNIAVAEKYPDVPEVYRLAVLSKYQSQGIGSALIAALELESIARRFDHMGVGVSFDNPRAAALYSRLGYEQSSVVEYYDEYLYSGKNGAILQARDKCQFLIKRLNGRGDR